jgi:hypothetical protein
MTLKQNYNLLVKRIWNPKIYDYEFNFRKAILNSHVLKLNDYSNFEVKNYQIASDEKQKIIDIILYHFYEKKNLEIEDLTLKCFWISNILRDFLKEAFGINSIITTGNVYVNKLRVNYESYSSIRKRLLIADYIAPIKFHTWLTLDNLDVIDLTLAPNMWIDGIKNGSILNRKDYEKIVWNSTKKIDKKGIIYEPKIIGYEYFNKINVPISLLMS